MGGRSESGSCGGLVGVDDRYSEGMGAGAAHKSFAVFVEGRSE